jgi:hypothetical protein
MSVVMVRQQVKDGSVEEAEAAVRDLFATLDRVRPEGVRYASTRVVGSSIEDPRPAIPRVPAVPGAAQGLGGRTAGDRAPRRRRLVQPVRNPARGIRPSIGGRSGQDDESPDLRGLSKERMKGLEPSTFCMASRRSSQLSYIRGSHQSTEP